MTKFLTQTLPCGLRIILLPSPSQVIYCGYQIAAGTRHEQPGQEGLAHFCEHVTFKGTRRRNALQVINSLEQVGGDLNAYTNKEDTTFYAAIQSEHIAKAIDILTDIVFCSQYPQHEIEKEVAVICDEIESYNDSPSELIFEEFENILFKGHPLGHNILGDAQQLHQYTSSHILEFARHHYRPDNAIFFAYGNLDFRKLQTLLQRCLATAGISSPKDGICKPSLPADNILSDHGVSIPLPPATSQGATIIKEINSHQAHVMTGCRAYDIHHPLRIVLYLLNNILGGPSMNALLNLSLRERNALVYGVDSSMVNYSDTGLWAIYFGCDPHDVNRCLHLIRHQLDRMMSKPLSNSRLVSAKRQLKGQIAIACDNREQFALDFGKSFLHYGWEKNIDSLFRNIDEVTAEQLQHVAQELFAPDRLTTLIMK